MSFDAPSFMWNAEATDSGPRPPGRRDAAAAGEALPTGIYIDGVQEVVMDLTLRFFANFREAVGQKTLEREYPDEATVGDVLESLVEEYGLDLFEDGEMRDQLSIMKNGTDVVHIEGRETPLADGDTLSVFPPVAGG